MSYPSFSPPLLGFSPPLQSAPGTVRVYGLLSSVGGCQVLPGGNPSNYVRWMFPTSVADQPGQMRLLSISIVVPPEFMFPNVSAGSVFVVGQVYRFPFYLSATDGSGNLQPGILENGIAKVAIGPTYSLGAMISARFEHSYVPPLGSTMTFFLELPTWLLQAPPYPTVAAY